MEKKRLSNLFGPSAMDFSKKRINDSVFTRRGFEEI